MTGYFLALLLFLSCDKILVVKQLPFILIAFALIVAAFIGCKQVFFNEHTSNQKLNTMETASVLHSPFDSFDEFYDNNGVFSKKIKIPYKVWRNNGKNILLKPEHTKRFDISANGQYTILEIVYHGEAYEGSLDNAPLIDEKQTGYISSIIPNFNASSQEPVNVITIHDERFLKLPQSTKAEVLETMRKYVYTNGCNFSVADTNEIIGAYTLNQKIDSSRLAVGMAVLKPL